MAVMCNTCNVQTNMRVGMSNRAVQPFRFCCQACGSPINFTIGQNEGQGKDFTGAREIRAHGPFDDKTNFVDLHLDFPVKFGKYVMGHTPFMMAVKQVDPSSTSLLTLNRLPEPVDCSLNMMASKKKSHPGVSLDAPRMAERLTTRLILGQNLVSINLRAFPFA